MYFCISFIYAGSSQEIVGFHEPCIMNDIHNTFVGGVFFSLGRMARDVEVDSDTVYDWHTMLHLQLYFQGHKDNGH